MRRVLAIALVVAACSPVSEPSNPTVLSSAVTTLPPSSTTSIGAVGPALAETNPAAVDVPRIDWYLVSVTAALPPGFSVALDTIEGVNAVSTVRVGILHLVESRGAGETPIHRR